MEERKEESVKGAITLLYPDSEEPCMPKRRRRITERASDRRVKGERKDLLV